MTRDTSIPTAGPSGWTKTALQALTGAVAGAGAMIAALTIFDSPGRPRLELDEILTLGVAVVYGLMGLFVALGALFPKPGSALLNVEDEGELREQRVLFGSSALSCLAIAASAVVLLLGSPGIAAIAPRLAAILFALCLAAAIAFGHASSKATDEFGQRMSTESSGLFLALMALLFGGWAAAAHLGLAPMFSGLAFYSGSLALYLGAVFWVVGRRGLLRPRG